MDFDLRRFDYYGALEEEKDMDELIRRVDVARPLLEKYREVKRQAERARNLRNLGSCLAFRSDMETLRACIQIAVEAPAMGEAGGMIQEAAVPAASPAGCPW